MARDFPPAILISSLTVLTSMRRGDAPVPACPPTSCVLLSETLVTAARSSRSYHSLAVMPLTDVVAPERIVP